ncbi:hypothetical protein HDU97_009781 [Phlyctochytrium planicorne]|nr:hypothetical protein HDU97_009781 [Phlyctochytrium planicorne]
MSSEIRNRKGNTAGTVASPAEEPPKIEAGAKDTQTLKGDSPKEQLKVFVDDAKFRESRSAGAWSAALILVSALSFLTRVYRIDHPNQVVFDEVHFGKFASYYLRGEYFFDVHPPLGKLLLAAMGLFVGYDGHFLFENIGDDYVANKVPYIGLRLMPATFGALVVPFSFLILKEVGISVYGALFGAFVLILDNALINQSRLILLDSMLMFFGVWSIYNWIRFYKERHRPFTASWWFWLSMTGVALACTLGVKMVGLFTIGVVGIAVLVDLWRLLDFRRGVSNREFIRHFSARALCLIFLPIAIYLSFFYIHFEVLKISGPGDAFMSPAFQAELQGSDVAANSVAIPFGAVISMKHREKSVFLHSHVDKYPLRYEDGRVSSQGQQVTGYPHKDPNNEWEVMAVDPELHPVDDYEPTTEETKRGVRYLRHQDIVRLRHVSTNSFLLTHDVASPLTTTNMEVTTFPGDVSQVERYNDTLWRIEITDGEANMKVRSRRSHFRIISVAHKVALTVNKGVLPEWGFGQSEINGNKNILESANVFYAEDVLHERIVNGTEIDEAADPVGKPEKKLPFLQKFVELQGLMISHNAGLTKPHPYSSTPITWPFVLRGISFWETKEGLKQIYLLGNPLSWWASITGTLMFVAMWILDRILLRRGIDDFGTSIRRWWDRSIGFLFLVWLLHWLPFFLMGRMLFLHHYLPSFIFSTLVMTCVFEFIGRIVMEDPVGVATGNTTLAEVIPFKSWMRKTVSLFYILFLFVTCASFAVSFYYFAPLTYGLGFDSVEDIRARKWLSSWDLQHA